MAVLVILDGISCVNTGILKAIGLQSINAFTGVFAFYGIGIPCALLFCFKLHMGVIGLYTGFSVGTLVQVLGYSYFLLCYDNDRYFKPQASVKSYMDLQVLASSSACNKI